MEKLEIVIADLKEVIKNLKDSEADKDLWEKEIIAIRNAINYLKILKNKK